MFLLTKKHTREESLTLYKLLSFNRPLACIYLKLLNVQKLTVNLFSFIHIKFSQQRLLLSRRFLSNRTQRNRVALNTFLIWYGWLIYEQSFCSLNDRLKRFIECLNQLNVNIVRFHFKPNQSHLQAFIVIVKRGIFAIRFINCFSEWFMAEQHPYELQYEAVLFARIIGILFECFS